MKLLIKKVRQEVGMGITELAKKSGISQSYLSELEAGKKKNVGIEVICKLAKALNVRPERLYDCEKR